MDLITRLRAAIDETERLALAANVKQDDPEWFVSPVLITGGRHFTVRSQRDARPIARVERLEGDEDGSEPGDILDGEAAANHIARHDPASVLRMVAAHRTILDQAEVRLRSYVGTGAQVAFEWSVVRLLAEAYGIEV